MKRVLSAILIAAASTAASWAVHRWLQHRRTFLARGTRVPIETWESEGGALASPDAASRAPR